MAEAFGLEIGDLPDGWQAIEVIAVVKCVALDDDAGMTHSIRATPTLDMIEGVGLLEVATELVRRDAVAMFQTSEGDE